MATIKIEKVNSLPTTPVPNTMYLVKVPNTKFFEIFVTDNAGTEFLSESTQPAETGKTLEPFALLGVR